MTSIISADFARQHFGPSVRVTLQLLSGGLEARGISRVVVHRGQKIIGSFVAKPFTRLTFREVEIYRLLEESARGQQQLAPALLGVRYTGAGEGYAFLEWIPADDPWPWESVGCSMSVVERLARLHQTECTAALQTALDLWDYEGELNHSAHWTLDAYLRVRRAGLWPGSRPMSRTLERMVAELPRLRSQLLSFTGTALLHGDVHSGNVVLTKPMFERFPVFIDWARARMGSPLEDVASWVHSLSLWAPEARRRHDTLLQRYIAVRGFGSKLSRTFREACVLAGACNALAGALRYHLSVLESPDASGEAKADSGRAAADWLRLIRRADCCFAA